MRLYLLDSTILAAYLHGRSKAVNLIEPWITQHQAATSILVYAEVLEYIKSIPKFNILHNQLKLLLREIYPFFLTYPILERYADIRRTLRPPRGKGLIGDIDTLIAATAVERNLILVTTDSDFKRNIPSLKFKLIPRETL